MTEVKNMRITKGFTESAPRVSGLKRFIRVFFSRGVVIFGFFIVVLVLVAAVFSPWVAPHDPHELDLSRSFEQPSLEHPLGTDSLGRDTLSRIIYGSRASLLVGIGAIAIAATIGISLGLIAGYFGGFTYTAIMRFMDTMMAFPMILLALAIAALLGGGLINVMIAIGFLGIPAYARLMCGQILSLREQDFISASRAIGAGSLRIMLRHLAPNSLSPIIVQISMMMGYIILVEASLSFLGVGIEAPTAAWGSMVSSGYQYLLKSPVLSFAPGLAIMLTVFAFNMVGDGLRDALDPRLRGTM